MKKIFAFLLAACMLLSGCGKGRSDSQETVGQPTEQAVEIETERVTETEAKETEKETEFLQEATETEADSEENPDVSKPLDLTGEDPKAYDLSWEELRSLRKEREVKEASQDTELPRELADLLQGILIRQLYEGWFTAQDFSADDVLEPYKAKSREVDKAAVQQFLSDPEKYDFYEDNMLEAYIADLDGDGKEEMIVLSDCGGTIHDRYVSIWRQKEDGTGVFMQENYTYHYTNTGLLSIGGNYYYVAELLDYYGEYEGFLVFSFLGDGTVNLDKVTMESQENGKIWKKLYENETIESTILDNIRTYIESKKSEIENKESWRGEVEIPYEESEYDFAVETFNLRGDLLGWTVVDFDNDGEVECYCISASGQSAKVLLKKRGSHVEKLELTFPGYSFGDNIFCQQGILRFEEFDGKNYIFRMDRLRGTSDYFLIVQLIQERKLYPVMNYLLLDNKVCKYEKADPEFYINYK